MKNLARVCCAAAALLMIPGLAVAGSGITILIVKPTLVRNVNEGSIAGIYARVEGEIRLLFPCARVLSADDIRNIAGNDRENRVRSGNSDGVSEKLADLVRADLVVNMEFGSTGTTHQNPGRYMTTTTLDMRKGRAVARNTSTGEGWDWSKGDFVEETLAPLRRIAYDICPWVGTIEYTRRLHESTDTSETLNETDGTRAITSVYTTRTRKNENETFRFELTRNGLRPVKVEASGDALMTSSGEQKTEWKSKGCFPVDANGVVRDVGYVSGVADTIVDKQQAEGTVQGALLSPKVVLTRVDETLVNGVLMKIPSWVMSVEALASGTAEMKGTNERSGGCGGYSMIDPAHTGSSPYGRLVSFLVDSIAETKGELTGRRVLQASDNEREEVTWKLTRK